MPEDAVLETPLEVSEIETPEIGEVEQTEPIEGEGEQQTPEQIEADSKLPLLKQARPQIEKIKAENPALARKITDALAQYDRYKPNELKEATALRSEVTNLATTLGDPALANATPAQVMAEVKGRLEYFGGLDELFTNRPQEFVSKLFEASPESAQSMAIPVFAEFSKTNPDGYGSYISQVALKYLDQRDIPLHFKAFDFIVSRLSDSPELQEIKAAVDGIRNGINGMRELAKNPLTLAKKDTTPQDLETQKDQIEAQRLDVTRQSWNQSATRYGNDLMSKEIARLAGKTQVSDEVRGKIVRQVAEELDARLTATKGYGEAMRQFLKTGDQESYKRRLHSEYQKLIPGAVSRAYSDNVQKSGPQAVRKPAAQQTPAVKTAATPGFRTVSSYPQGQVDLTRTTRAMMDQKMYILKDGSKVKYERRA